MRLSLVARIVLMFVAVAAVYALVSLYQSSRMREAARELDLIRRDYAPLAKSLAQLENAMNDFVSTTEHAMALADSGERLLWQRQVVPPAYEGVSVALAQALAQIDSRSLTARGEPRQKGYIELQDGLHLLLKHHEQQIEVLQKALATPPDPVTSAELRERLRQERRQVKVVTQTLDRELARHLQVVIAKNEQSSWSGLILSALAASLALGAAFLTNYSLRPLKRLTQAAQLLGAGDYRTALDIPASRDELGSLAREFEHMRLSLLARDRALNEQAQKLELSNRDLETLKLHYETVLDNLRFPVLVADLQARIKTLNPAAREVLQLGSEDVRGQSLASLPLGETLLGEQLDISAILREGQTQVREALNVGADETGRRVTLRAAPLLENGRVRGLVIVGEDVTDALRVQSDLADSQRHSEADRIGAKVAHEIRNPLSSIALNVELLQEELDGTHDLDPEATAPLLVSILREVERLQAITETYLKRGRATHEARRLLDLNSLVAHLAEFYQAEFSSRGVACNLDLAGAPCHIFADENRVVRVLHNLIKNALEAMPQGGRLVLRSEGRAERCLLHVVDSGTGVAESIRERIFDPFFTTKEAGTGLGLALAHQIAEEFEATLTLLPSESGAHFLLDWPRAIG